MSNPYLLKQARLALAMDNPRLAIEELQKITPPSNAARLPILLDDANLKIALAQAYLQEASERGIGVCTGGTRDRATFAIAFVLSAFGS